jgi:hypothetical protein
MSKRVRLFLVLLYVYDMVLVINGLQGVNNFKIILFHSCTVHFRLIQSFITPTNAQ